MPSLQAELELDSRYARSRLTYDRYYDLLYRATDDADFADRMAAQFALQEMKSGRTP
jgi:hypothetical protein